LKETAGSDRTTLLSYLDEKRIGTRLLFAGNLTKQPYMANQKYRVSGKLTNTDTVMNQTFWVGTYPGLEEDHLDYIAEALEEFFGVGF